MTSVHDYKTLCRLGEGTYGVVYKALLNTQVNSNNFVALKKIRIDKEAQGLPVSAQREISILKKTRHENIVEVLKVVVGKKLDDVFLVMEYCSIDLAYMMDNVISKGNGFSTSQIKCLMIQLLKGVDYLHYNYIIHRDLKLSNLLLTKDGVLKIADFGLARLFSQPLEEMTPNVVTLWYRSPELVLGSQNYSTCVDIWSVGCIFGEFLLSSPLMPGDSEVEQLMMIHDLLGSFNERIWPAFSELPFAQMVNFAEKNDDFDSRFSSYSSACKRLLKRMLAWNPDHRTSARDALDASFFIELPMASARSELCTPYGLGNLTDSPRLKRPRLEQD
jgi:cyclin-dependent kinase 10